MSSPVVLLVAPPGAAVPDVVGPLTDAGFAVEPAAPSPVAVVLLADAVADPVAVTAQLRQHHSPSVPLLWLLSRESAHLAPAALDAGADACLLRPAPGPLLVAQLRAAVRSRSASATADEVRDLTARLQKLYEQVEADRALVEKLAALTPTAIPDVSGWRFGVVGPGGVDPLTRGDSLAVVLVEVAGLGAVGGALVAGGVWRELRQWFGPHPVAARPPSPSETVPFRDGGRGLTELQHRIGSGSVSPLPPFAQQTVSEGDGPGVRASYGRRETSTNPAVALTAVGHWLRAVELPESAVVSATVAHFATAGGATTATAGFPAPVLVHPNSSAEVWLGSGPFLGATDSAYHDTFAELEPGEKLILLGRGAADLRPDVRDIADRHRHLDAQPLADAIQAGLGAIGITLVVAERVGP